MEIWHKIKLRKEVHQVLTANTDREKGRLKGEYKVVKESARRDKRNSANALVEQVQTAADSNDSRIPRTTISHEDFHLRV